LKSASVPEQIMKNAAQETGKRPPARSKPMKRGFEITLTALGSPVHQPPNGLPNTNADAASTLMYLTWIPVMKRLEIFCFYLP